MMDGGVGVVWAMDGGVGDDGWGSGGGMGN